MTFKTKRLKNVPSLLFVIATALGTLLSCASPHLGARSDGSDAGKAQAEQIPLVGAYKVNRFTLSYGLRLLVVEDHSSPTFSYQTWFKVGSRDEFQGRTGLAHLFEHLMFKATTHHKEGEFDHLLEGAGAQGENAFTSWDYTAYIQELPKSQLDLIAQLESDRMINLGVNEQSFRTELEVVQNERRFRTENSPEGQLFQDLFGLAFEKHSYHWPVIGYQADLQAMTAMDALNFYHSHYSPNHATIVVSGDVVPSQVLATVQKYYGSLTAQESPPHEILVEAEQTSARRKQIKLNIQVEKLIAGYHIPNALSADVPALNIFESILTGGKSSRLHRALVDTGIAGTVEASMMEQKDPGLFIIEVSLQKGKKATQAESVILREIQKLAAQGPTEAELLRAKNRSEFGFYQGLDTNPERTNFLGRYEAVTGDFEIGIKNHLKMNSVTLEEVIQVAQKYFKPTNRTVVTGVKQ